MLTCAACGNTWQPASGASCPACLVRGRRRDGAGRLEPDPRWFDPDARSSGIQASTEAFRRPRRRKPKAEKHKYCKRCDEEITVGDRKRFCESCRVENCRDRSLARYYRLKSESRCPFCEVPVLKAVLCEACKAKMRAKTMSDRDKRVLKRSRKRLHARRRARGRCIYCANPNATQYLGCAECRTYRLGELHRWLAVKRNAETNNQRGRQRND